MTLRGVLLDFNGTLFFDSDMHMEAFRRAFPKYNKAIPSDDFLIHHCFGRTNTTIYRENMNPNATQEEINGFIECKETIYREFCLERPEAFRLADGATELLNTLQEAGIPFCLATGSDWGNVSFYIEQLKLDKWFSQSNMVWDTGAFPGKPSPEIYKRAAAKLGLTPSECLVYEDGTSGILSANRAGAGAVIAVYDKKYPSPLNDETRVDAIYHDHLNWKQILTEYGLLK